MKPQFKLIVNNSRNKIRRVRVAKASPRLTIVPTEKAFATAKPLSRFLNRCLKWLGSILIKLDEFASKARETDEQIRKMRAEHYAKYGFYFRDRF
jgi:hypothetical protein